MASSACAVWSRIRLADSSRWSCMAGPYLAEQLCLAGYAAGRLRSPLSLGLCRSLKRLQKELRHGGLIFWQRGWLAVTHPRERKNLFSRLAQLHVANARWPLNKSLLSSGIPGRSSRILCRKPVPRVGKGFIFIRESPSITASVSFSEPWVNI